MQDVVQAMERMNASSRSIRSVIEMINSIAEETGLLALERIHRGGAGKRTRSGFRRRCR